MNKLSKVRANKQCFEECLRAKNRWRSFHISRAMNGELSSMNSNPRKWLLSGGCPEAEQARGDAQDNQ